MLFGWLSDFFNNVIARLHRRAPKTFHELQREFVNFLTVLMFMTGDKVDNVLVCEVGDHSLNSCRSNPSGQKGQNPRKL